jgi:hypothetical protein
MAFDLHRLPALPQSQDPLADQIASLILVANRLGLFDAADAVSCWLTASVSKYGCHVDLKPGQEPDGCVIDKETLHDCIYAKEGMRKEQCHYWRIVLPIDNSNK